MKRTAGRTEDKGSWPRADQQHVVYFFSKVEISNACTITEARCCSSNLPQGTRGELYTALFWWYKVRKIVQTYVYSACKINILMEFNLMHQFHPVKILHYMVISLVNHTQLTRLPQIFVITQNQDTYNSLIVENFKVAIFTYLWMFLLLRIYTCIQRRS